MEIHDIVSLDIGGFDDFISVQGNGEDRLAIKMNNEYIDTIDLKVLYLINVRTTMGQVDIGNYNLIKNPDVILITKNGINGNINITTNYRKKNGSTSITVGEDSIVEIKLLATPYSFNGHCESVIVVHVQDKENVK